MKVLSSFEALVLEQCSRRRLFDAAVGSTYGMLVMEQICSAIDNVNAGPADSEDELVCFFVKAYATLKPLSEAAQGGLQGAQGSLRSKVKEGYD